MGFGCCRKYGWSRSRSHSARFPRVKHLDELVPPGPEQGVGRRQPLGLEQPVGLLGDVGRDALGEEHRRQEPLEPVPGLAQVQAQLARVAGDPGELTLELHGHPNRTDGIDKLKRDAQMDF